MVDDKANTTNIENEIYKRVLAECTNKLNNIKDLSVRDSILLALDKTLNNIKEGKLSPAIFPILIEKDLQLDEEDLAFDLAVICAYFHTAADLADDIEDNSKNNPVINKYGVSQAVNISTKLMFLYQELILNLKIDDFRKVKLMSFFANCGNVMSNGQFNDLALTNKIFYPHSDKSITNNNIITISKTKSGAEIGCFMSAILVALGKPEELYYDLGVLYGSLIQIFSDYMDIWGQIVSDDLVCLKNTLPIFAAYNDPEFKEITKLLLAGKNDYPQVQYTLKRYLSKTQAVEAFISYFETCEGSIKCLLEILPPLENFTTMIEDLFSSCKILYKTILELREQIKLTEKFSENIDLTPSINMAVDYIDLSSNFEETWEIQRWGFLNEPNLIANVFTPALMAETIFDAGYDIEKNIKFLMGLKGDIGWYYYTNTNKIPTDSDVLGQLLHLVAKTGNTEKYRDLFTEPLRILENNIEDSGRCPTWLDDGINHFKSEIEKKWYGNDCIGVMANLYYGLFLFDKDKYSNLINKGVEYILNNLNKEKTEAFNGEYYNSSYKFYLVSRLINSLNIDSYELNNLKREILKSQSIDGSWNNSTQDTTFIMLALMTFPNVNVSVVKAAAKYLIDTQNYDGSWDEEDLYICPGKNGKTVYYKNKKITTSFCLRALNQFNKKLNNEKDSSVIKGEIVTCQN